MEHKGTVILETPRLILRRARREDAEAMFRNWASDPEVTKFLTWPTYVRVEDAYPILDIWTAGYAALSFYHWMIVSKETGEPIGSIGIVSENEQAGKAEIGYCIGRAWWHRGIMTEALQAVMNFLFDEVGYQRLEAKHDPRNPHSGAVMRKCGMTYEGTHRQAERNNQGICDVCVYALLARERGND